MLLNVAQSQAARIDVYSGQELQQAIQAAVAGDEIVHPDDPMTFTEQPVGEMRSQKTGAAGFFIPNCHALTEKKPPQPVGWPAMKAATG